MKYKNFTYEKTFIVVEFLRYFQQLWTECRVQV